MQNLKNDDGNILVTVMMTMSLGLGLVTFSEQTQNARVIHNKVRAHEVAKNANSSSVKLMEALVLSRELSVVNFRNGYINDRSLFPNGRKPTTGGKTYSNLDFIIKQEAQECQEVAITYEGSAQALTPAEKLALFQKAVQYLKDTITDPVVLKQQIDDLEKAYKSGLFNPSSASVGGTKSCPSFIVGEGADKDEVEKFEKQPTKIKLPKPSGSSRIIGYAPKEGTIIDLDFDPKTVGRVVTTRPPTNEIVGNPNLYLELNPASTPTIFNYNASARSANNKSNPPDISLLCARTKSTGQIWGSGNRMGVEACSEEMTRRVGTIDGENKISVADLKDGMITQTSVDFLEGRLDQDKLYAHITARTYYLERNSKQPEGVLRSVEDKFMLKIPSWDVPSDDPKVVVDSCAVECALRPTSAKCRACKGDGEECTETYDENTIVTKETRRVYGTKMRQYSKYDPPKFYYQDGTEVDPNDIQTCLRTTDNPKYYKANKDSYCGEWEQFRLIDVVISKDSNVRFSRNSTYNPSTCHTSTTNNINALYVDSYIQYYERTRSCPAIVIVTCTEECEPDHMGGKHCTSICDTSQCVYVGSHMGKTYCRMQGCFSLDTPLTLANGETRTYDTLKDTDILLNPVTGKGMGIREVRLGPEDKLPSYKVGYGKYDIHVSSLHPFPIRNISGSEVVKPAKKLLLTDSILGEDGQYYRINRLEEVPVDPNLMVYNVALETDSDNPLDHFILANGIITGDLWLQRYLEKYDGVMPVFLQGMIRHKPLVKNDSLANP